MDEEDLQHPLELSRREEEVKCLGNNEALELSKRDNVPPPQVPSKKASGTSLRLEGVWPPFKVFIIIDD
jgi:hypothetical protein